MTKLPFRYVDTPERRVLNLAPDGVPCVPVLGFSNYKQTRHGTIEHVHPGILEVSFCQRGSLVFESGGQTYAFLPGNIFVSQPDEWHRLQTNPKGLVMYWLFFHFPSKGHSLLGLPQDESSWLEHALRSFPHRMFHGTDRVRHAFQRLFKLYDTLPPKTAQRRLAVRATVLELLLALIEAGAGDPCLPSREKIEPVIREMRKNPERDYPLDAILSQCALSPSVLTNLFKNTTGLPPHAFLLACRIQRAKELLRDSSQSVSQIAQHLNFSSPQHLAMHFKRETGVTPTAWRKQAR
ncbi:MAG: AraC family transcriptional regulator [Kiritimatiellae bacterium]|nr:AraC family transcriptional regulator [Kiritimatiellia bacterium]